MKLVRSTAVCTVVFLVMLGVAFAQHVPTDFDHQANFSQYKTYSWQENQACDSLWDARIKNAVDANWQPRAGPRWTAVAMWPVAIKTTQTRELFRRFIDGFGGGWGWRRFGAEGWRLHDDRTRLQRRNLVVDLYDAKASSWSGAAAAENTLSDKADKNERISTREWQRCSRHSSGSAKG